MKSCLSLRALVIAASFSLSVFLLFGLQPNARAASATDASGLPKSWIDPDTGHRVIRLTEMPRSATLYFNDGCDPPDGNEVVFTVTADRSAWMRALGLTRPFPLTLIVTQ